MLSPRANRVNEHTYTVAFRHVIVTSVEGGAYRAYTDRLGFATAWCLREDTERIRRFGATALLKLVNPIGNGSDHIARRFSS